MKNLDQQIKFVEVMKKASKSLMRKSIDNEARDYYRSQYLSYDSLLVTLKQFKESGIKFTVVKGEYGENRCPICGANVGYNSRCMSCGTDVTHNTLTYSKED